MKARLYTLLFSLIFAFSLPAQITITRDDVPQIRDSLTYQTDTLPLISGPGDSGPDQTWDFTQLTAADTFGLRVVPAGATPNAELFPDANLAIEIDGIFVYGRLTEEKLFNLGTAVDLLGTGAPILVRFDPPQQLFSFPTTFGTTYSGNYAFSVQAEGSIVNLPVDSVRFSRTTTESGTIDSYGTLRTPAGDYETLRLKVTSENTDTIFAQVAGFWTPVQTFESTEVEYRWLGKESGDVMSLFLDEEGNVESVDWLTAYDRAGEAVAPQADFTFSDQGDGAYQFADQSRNAPISWSWDFDDGSGSSLQNPTHTFSNSGDYNVCLTVSNSAGSNTSCQTVTVLLSSLETLKERYGFRLFPNPVRNHLRIQMEYPGARAPLVSFFNFAGQHLQTQPLNGQLRLDTSSWPAGPLTFVLRSPQGKRLGSGRVIKY